LQFAADCDVRANRLFNPLNRNAEQVDGKQHTAIRDVFPYRRLNLNFQSVEGVIERLRSE
jgi:hypothetical protein